MAEPVMRVMGLSAIKREREADFLRAFDSGRDELSKRLLAMGADACSLFRLGRYVFLYVELPENDGHSAFAAEAGGHGSEAQVSSRRYFPGSPETTDAANVESDIASSSADAGHGFHQASFMTMPDLADELDAGRLLAERLWSGELKALLEAWPSLGAEERFVLRLNDIFHDDQPMDDVPWRRPEWKPASRVGKLARLKPDMYASYVYLHYQLQEERPRLFSKYYTIGSFGSYIFSYEEQPGRVEPPRKGKLDSKQTPPDWGTAMYPHFEPWTDLPEDQQPWREMESLFHLGEQCF